jgi:hypothetical protein
MPTPYALWERTYRKTHASFTRPPPPCARRYKLQGADRALHTAGAGVCVLGAPHPGARPPRPPQPPCGPLRVDGCGIQPRAAADAACVLTLHAYINTLRSWGASSLLVVQGQCSMGTNLLRCSVCGAALCKTEVLKAGLRDCRVWAGSGVVGGAGGGVHCRAVRRIQAAAHLPAPIPAGAHPGR